MPLVHPPNSVSTLGPAHLGLYFPLKSPMPVTGVLEKAESQQSREVGLTFFGLARAQCRELVGFGGLS